MVRGSNFRVCGSLRSKRFRAVNERQIPFLCLSLLRNHTETLATQAKSVDKILCCDDSNNTFSAVLLHGATICFSVFAN